MISKVLNIDCITGMKEYPDKFFDLAIVDPPYGLDKKLTIGAGKLKNTPMSKLYKNKNWDIIPDKEYWIELFRISKNQVVFGANYFIKYLKNTRGIVCWDKMQNMPTLSSCELIWTSYDKPAKIIKKSSKDLKRFHPTQKPIYIYKYMYKYCKLKKFDKIIDTHLGSGSSRIAAYDLDFNFYGFETDEEYFNLQNKRFNEHILQTKLF